MPENPQHYIGVSSFGRVHVTFDMEALDKLCADPRKPLIIDDVTLYPVSAAIALEWSGHDEYYEIDD